MANKVRRSDAKKPRMCAEKRIASKDDVFNGQRVCYFAYLDILGFKDVVKNTTYDQLKEIVDGFTSKCKEGIKSSRTINTNTGSVLARIVLRVHVRIVSDSIYIWTKGPMGEESLKTFEDLLHCVNFLMAYGFERGMPLRGVVTYGELFSGTVPLNDNAPDDFTFENDSLYGRALVEAYELESRMAWSGVILTPKAWAKVIGDFEKQFSMYSGKSPEDLFKKYPYLLWYDVPFKGGARRAIALNWNYMPEIAKIKAESKIDLSAETIHRAFTRRCVDVNADVKQKLRETIRFYEYTQRVAELCDFKSVKMLPTPDPSYVLSDLSGN